MQKKIEKFNDGVLIVYNAKQKQSSFNAFKNVTSKDELEFVVKLAYEEMSKRDQDFEFAEAKGRTLSLKLKTRLVNGVNSTNRVIIGNELYSIIKLDSNIKKQLLYFYLEKERDINA